jgi:hypothetical protein
MLKRTAIAALAVVILLGAAATSLAATRTVFAELFGATW